MQSKYHKTASCQGKTIQPAGYAQRLKNRSALLSFDPQEIKIAEARGASLPVQPVGVSRGSACYKVHISPKPKRGEKKHTDKTVSISTGTSLPSYLESQKRDTREIYRIDLFPTSAIVRRDIVTPRPARRKVRKLNISDIDDVIPSFNTYSEANSLPSLSDEEILEAFNGSPRGKVNSFSRKSRARLKFTAANCFPKLICQFCLSYGNTVVPQNGRVTKNHLDRFLKDVRKKFPHVAYLWILEFQTRGAAHYHVFFSFPPRVEIQAFLAKTWVRITGAKDEETQKMLRVHLSPKNFIPWDMKKGGYLTKYIDKESQKHVPLNFQDVGRFWGTSRNLIPEPEQLFMQEEFFEITHTDKVTGETITTDTPKDIYRILRKHHEASIRQCGYKRKSRLIDTGRATTHLPSGGLLVMQWFAWKEREEWKISGLSVDDIPF